MLRSIGKPDFSRVCIDGRKKQVKHENAGTNTVDLLYVASAYCPIQSQRNPRATDSVSGVVLLERWSASDPPLYFCVHGTPAPPLPEDTPDETMPHPIQDAPAEMTQSNSPESETSTTGREDASNELQIEELPRPPEKAQAAGGREDESKEPQTPTGREDESKEPRTPVSRRPSGRAQAPESRRSSRKGQAAAGREDASKGPQTETGSVNPEEGPSGQQKVRCRVGWHCRRVSWPTRCRHLLCRKEQ
ncbi:hypothetical protein TGRUB_299010 [Toxoplasma gondii RUB]|uniref:Uncharacterized protein n=1 Tax=Toxoplasma gondii RUB TaxID=935652 RepID=A0A086LT77_TOXGO|nr:hypothetical protein TGRUB_299010 [Toxoplasma gondii RUB]